MVVLSLHCKLVRRTCCTPGAPERRQVRCRTPTLRAAGGISGVRQNDKQSAEVAQLTNEIVEAESKLAALFEPGKPMPRAGVVAAMRQEVSEMKARLAALMSGGVSGSIPAAVLDAPAPSDDELAERARQAFLEVERLLGQKSGGSRSRDDGAAMAVLEAENERLRLEATALLLRQQQLEELLDKHKLGDRV